MNNTRIRELVFLTTLLFGPVLTAHAATYWVSPSGAATLCSQIDGDTDPGAYMTPSAIASNGCAAAGDTIIFKSGTYTGPIVRPDQMIPSGISATQRSRLICEGDRTCQIAYNTESHGHGGIFTFWDRRNLIIGQRGNGFDINAANAPNQPGGIRFHLSSSANPQIYSNILFEGNTIRNMGGNGIGAHRYSNDHMYTNVVIRYNTIGPWASSTQVPDAPHGIYATGEDWLIEHNEIHTMATPSGTYTSFAIQGWHYANRTIIRYNELIMEHSSGAGITNGNSKTNTPTNAIFHNNVIRCPANNCTAMAISLSGPADQTSVYNNTVSGFAVFINVKSGNVGSIVKNNLCTNGACAINIESPATITCGGTCTTINPTVTAASHFVNAASGDFSLLSTSTQINAGLDVGFPYSGSAPDRGAHESIPAPTASITANVLTLTFAANTFLPISNLSTTGLTVACTGSACPGSPTVATVTRRAGTDTIIDVTISGITGDACEAANQNWTATYNGLTGSWSDLMLLGGTNNQKVFSFTSLAATNACTGSGPPAPPAGLYISYAFDEGTGTTADNTGSLGAPGDGTLQNGVTWANGGGVTITQQSTQYVAVPYGSGVNPTTQDLTVAFTIDVLPANTGSSLSYFGSQLGTNQRFHILTQGGTWRMGIGSFAGSASEFSVTSGPQHVCLTADGGTFTLHVNGVASTTAGGLQTGVGSYTLASNFELGRIATLTTGGGGTYRHFQIYTSVENCNTIYQATLGGGGSLTGTYSQAAYKAQDVFTTSAGTPVDRRAVNTPVTVAVNGAVALEFQVNCDDCSDTAFRVTARKNGSGSYLQVPNTETADGIYMWGASSPTYLNTGNPGAEISGSCTEQAGATLTTADQTPTVPFPTSACVVLRYLVRIGENASPGDYFELRLESQAGGPLDTYTNTARINVTEKAMVQ